MTYYCQQHAGDLLSLLLLLLIGIQTPGPRGSVLSIPLSTSAGQLDTSLLENRCRQFMVQVWPLQCTRSKKVLRFFPSGREAPPNGSPCPAEEWMLCLFVSFLAESIQHSSIKVALFTCTKQGFPDPLLNCLHLQRVLRGITQGSLAAHG